MPVTPKHPEVLRANASWNDVPPRIDDYAWLRDDARNSSAVLAHLQEESAYADAVLAPSTGLQARLLAEMRARLPRQEASVPQRRGRHWCACARRCGAPPAAARSACCCAFRLLLPPASAAGSHASSHGWLRSRRPTLPPALRPLLPRKRYYTVRGEGSQYGRICRRPVADPGAEPSEHETMDLAQPEQVLLDQDELAGARVGLSGLCGLSVSSERKRRSASIGAACRRRAHCPPAARPPPRAGQQRAPAFLTLPLPSPAAVAAGGRAYFDLAGPEWSVDEELMAYGVDGRGDEVYTL